MARQLSPLLEGGELGSRLRVDLTHLHAGGAGVLGPCFQGTSFDSSNTQGENMQLILARQWKWGCGSRWMQVMVLLPPLPPNCCTPMTHCPHSFQTDLYKNKLDMQRLC